MSNSFDNDKGNRQGGHLESQKTNDDLVNAASRARNKTVMLSPEMTGKFRNMVSNSNQSDSETGFQKRRGTGSFRVHRDELKPFSLPTIQEQKPATAAAPVEVPDFSVNKDTSAMGGFAPNMKETKSFRFDDNQFSNLFSNPAKTEVEQVNKPIQQQAFSQPAPKEEENFESTNPEAETFIFSNPKYENKHQNQPSERVNTQMYAPPKLDGNMFGEFEVETIKDDPNAFKPLDFQRDTEIGEESLMHQQENTYDKADFQDASFVTENEEFLSHSNTNLGFSEQSLSPNLDLGNEKVVEDLDQSGVFSEYEDNAGFQTTTSEDNFENQVEHGFQNATYASNQNTSEFDIPAFASSQNFVEEKPVQNFLGSQQFENSSRNQEFDVEENAVSPGQLGSSMPNLSSTIQLSSRDSLIVGFMISFDNQQSGEVFEIRSGRWLVTSRPTNHGEFILINDSSISPLHAIVRATANGVVQVLDQLSEYGTTVVKAGTSEEIEISGTMIALEHGDVIRFGERKFIVCLVPRVI